MLLIHWINQQKPGVITRLHHATGLSYSAVQKAVRGATKPRHETARLIAAATGGKVSLDEVYAPPHLTHTASAAAPPPPTDPPPPRAIKAAPAPAKAAKRAAAARAQPRKPAKATKRPTRGR